MAIPSSDPSKQQHDAVESPPQPSRCPVQHGEMSSSSSSQQSWWEKLVTAAPQAAAENEFSLSKTSSESPVVASVEEAARYAQLPQPDQTVPLSTTRQVSSIPRSSSSSSSSSSNNTSNDSNVLPAHQATTTTTEEDSTNTNNNKHWIYPSEQQLYNAMRKKGWQNIPQDSIPTVLQIHNTINEQTWRHVQAYYDDRSSSTLELTRFQGRPQAVSPRAWWNCTVWGWCPFDRHDWYVSDTTANNAPPRRFVIDYYYRNEDSIVPVPYIDARPALDDPWAVVLRTRRWLQLALPGITRYLQARGGGQQ